MSVIITASIIIGSSGAIYLQSYVDLKWIFIGLGALGLLCTIVLQIGLVEPKKKVIAEDISQTINKSSKIESNKVEELLNDHNQEKT